MKKTDREVKVGDKITIAGVRYGKYPDDRTFTTRCWKGKESILTVTSNDTFEIKPGLCIQVQPIE